VRRKGFSHGGVVVDLAVEGEHGPAVAGGHGLRRGGGEVDDGEASVAEAAAGHGHDPVAVGAAVGQGVGHRAQERGVGGLSVRERDADDAAHGACPATRPGPGS